ncbi:MAG: LysR family transcriptional regulator [Alphaproteobacteria bacterium]|nr:MAG: LysR family transcriptional regulator [Alphaproteobacteria bacterium]
MDQLTGLRVFVEVAERSGFSAAARHLGISTTMASAHVQALEDRLGVRLFNRTTRKVSLTDVGRGYYERCRSVLEDLSEADDIASAQQSSPRGLLRLYTSYVMVRFMAPVLSEFMETYPEVTVDLSLGERMPDMVEEGYDLALRTLLPPDSNLIARQLVPWRHVACCSPGYLEGKDIPKVPADLVGHNCLQYTFYPFGREWHFTGPDGRPDNVRVSGNFLTHSADALRHLAYAGHGILLVPSFMVETDFQEGRLVQLLADWKSPEFSISAVFPHRQHMPARVRLFVDLLARRFATHGQLMNL